MRVHIHISYHARQRLKERLALQSINVFPIVYDAYFKGEGLPKQEFLELMRRDKKKRYLDAMFKVYKDYIFIFKKDKIQKPKFATYVLLTVLFKRYL